MVPAQGFEALQTNKLIFTQITEMIGITMKVSLMGGFILAFPIVLFHMSMFISPGLTSKEKRLFLMLAPLSLICFILGTSFGYFLLLPPGLHFLFNFGSDIASPMIRIGNYINVVVTLLFWLGISFETPLVMYFLTKIGITRSTTLKRGRRYSIVVAFILGALITPTFDPVNQTLVAVPIVMLYQIGVWLSAIADRGRDRSELSLSSGTDRESSQ